MGGNAELERRLGSIEDLLQKVEAAADPSLRATVQELIELVMSLHGAGLDRMLELMQANGDAGNALIQKVAGDELISSLLVLHGIHPMDLETRVVRALDRVKSRLQTHGGGVEVLNIEDGNIRLRLQANGHGCGSTANTLKGIVEEAVYQAAPDLTTLLIEGAPEKQGFVPLDMLLNQVPATAGKGA
jgi:Fe-S cluster biogenesis protein NfuA